MPYEGQPFQNAIFKKISEKNKNIETVDLYIRFQLGYRQILLKE